MPTIHKYPLMIQDRQIVEISTGAELLSVQMQEGIPCLWALVEPHQMPAPMEIFIFGTGQPVYVPGLVFIDTFQIPEQGLVFHVFRRA